MFLSILLFFPPLLLPSPSSGLSKELEGLKLVHIVFRHGDRTPIDIFPTDPYKDRSNWPVGFGQLLNRGKLRHFELGQWLRQRYFGFLGDVYDENEIYVRSTDVDRTLMSAEANLAGLYPPTSNQRWNKDLAWEPIPVHTVPQSEDALLSSHADCPRFTELQEQLLVSEDFRYLSDYVYDTLKIETEMNFTLDPWTKSVFPDGKFAELKDFSFLVDTYTPELRKLKGGPFLKEMIEHLDKFKSGELDPANRKVFMYSGHDTTIAPILHTLDVFDPPIAPAYAATILFELLEKEGVLSLQVSYKNESGDPFILTIPGCTQRCPLDKLKVLLAPMIPEDWRAECGLKDSNSLETRVTFIAAVVSSIMAVTVLLGVVYIICKKKQDGPEARYQRVANEI
ncbi:prostatic acid phosphatase [Eurytemora carolleeae]|uniref:prostatic acid phosphatase n=1 Tax=Eurytemora carolleeae TaxID=1294199 RepID=UPI000C7946E5|nr:prostatic acid phosphatase [Eurytemora carolleeae]|eukprot:XP_023331571.1 prostatic acid phosphatase-like [Eurytemora affinis]